MLRSRLTSTIFIYPSNTVARGCNLSREFWFHRLSICSRGTERDGCASRNCNTQEQRPHHYFPLPFLPCNRLVRNIPQSSHLSEEAVPEAGAMAITKLSS